MKVLFCQPTMQFSGSENSLYQLIETIQDDVEVSVMYAEKGPFLDKITNIVSPENLFYVQSSKLKRNFKAVIAFFASFRNTYTFFRDTNVKGKFSYVVVNTLMFPQAYIACRLLGIKSIMICRENKLTYGTIPFFFYSTASLISNFKIIVLFRKQITYFGLRGFFKKDKFKMVPNTISLKQRAIVSQNQNSKVMLLSVMGLSLRKGIYDLFEIVKLLYDEVGNKFCLTIVGKKDQKIIEHFTSKYPQEVQECVVFAGEQADTTPYFHKSDIFIHPSHTEALPRVLLEAIYYGKSVVATDVGGTDTIVHAQENGFLFQVGECAVAAERLGRLVLDENMRRDFGAKSERIFKENFSPDKIRSSFMELLK